MSKLDIARKKSEVLKMQAAKADMEFKILEREEEILRLRKNIEIQDEHVLKVSKELADLEAQSPNN